MASGNLRDSLLKTGRHDFPVFYATATARETKLMDMAILLTALFIRLKKPRTGNRHPETRDEQSSATERIFADLRREILKGKTFKKLPTLERQRIQRVIFDRMA